MLNKVARKLTHFLMRSEINAKYDKAVYIYGLELIISTTLCYVCIILSSVLLASWKEAVVFILVFSPLRTFAGGYHAKTYGSCFFISNTVYLLLLVINQIIAGKVPIVFLWIFYGVCACYIVKKAPIINENQPLNARKQELCKRNIRFILLFDVSVFIVLMLIDEKLLNMAITSVGLVAAFMLITDIYNWEYGKEVNEG